MYGIIMYMNGHGEHKKKYNIPMNITHHSHRSLHMLHIRLINEHLAHVLAEVLDGVLTEELTFGQLFYTLVQVQSHRSVLKKSKQVRMYNKGDTLPGRGKREGVGGKRMQHEQLKGSVKKLGQKCTKKNLHLQPYLFRERTPQATFMV